MPDIICMLFAVWYLLIAISFPFLFQKRDILTRTKQVRDALRIENVKLRQKCGLLGNEPLLRDYEQRKEQVFTKSTLSELRPNSLRSNERKLFTA